KYYSVLTGHVPNVSRFSKDVTDSVNGTIRTYMMNYPILNMFLRAFDKKPNFPLSHVILNVKDKSRFIPDSDDWELEHTYSYDAVFPSNMPAAKRLQKIKADLEFHFNLKGHFEKKKVKCMILTRTGQSD